MTWRHCFNGMAVSALLPILFAGPAAADDQKDCTSSKEPAAFDACSRLIASGKLRGQALAKVHVIRGSLIADALGLKTAQGTLVIEPGAGGPAQGVGILAGDLITKVDGKAVIDAPDLARRIGGTAAGAKVKVTVRRQDEEWTYHLATDHLTLGQLPQQREARAEPQPAEPPPSVKVDPAPSVKQLLEKHALLGVWAPDCSKPVSAQNKYLVLRAIDERRVQIDSMDGPTSSSTYVAASAVEPSPKDIALDVSGAGGEIKLPMRIEGDYLGAFQAWHHKCR